MLKHPVEIDAVVVTALRDRPVDRIIILAQELPDRRGDALKRIRQAGGIEEDRAGRNVRVNDHGDDVAGDLVQVGTDLSARADRGRRIRAADQLQERSAVSLDDLLRQVDQFLAVHEAMRRGHPIFVVELSEDIFELSHAARVVGGQAGSGSGDAVRHGVDLGVRTRLERLGKKAVIVERRGRLVGRAAGDGRGQLTGTGNGREHDRVDGRQASELFRARRSDEPGIPGRGAHDRDGRRDGRG